MTSRQTNGDSDSFIEYNNENDGESANKKLLRKTVTEKVILPVTRTETFYIVLTMYTNALKAIDTYTVL